MTSTEDPILFDLVYFAVLRHGLARKYSSLFLAHPVIVQACATMPGFRSFKKTNCPKQVVIQALQLLPSNFSSPVLYDEALR